MYIPLYTLTIVYDALLYEAELESIVEGENEAAFTPPPHRFLYIFNILICFEMCLSNMTAKYRLESEWRRRESNNYQNLKII